MSIFEMVGGAPHTPVRFASPSACDASERQPDTAAREAAAGAPQAEPASAFARRMASPAETKPESRFENPVKPLGRSLMCIHRLFAQVNIVGVKPQQV